MLVQILLEDDTTTPLACDPPLDVHAQAIRMGKPAGIRRRNRPSSLALLLSALVFISSSGRCLRSWAAVCNTTRTSFRVENLSDARELNAAVNCSNGGQLEAVWVGTVLLDAPIVIRSGTFLSIKGEGQQAEAQGGLSTHMFSITSGGGLTITELTLSGGAARSGGAIHALVAKLTLVRCVFEGNIANGGGGGAVFVSGGEVNITGGDFRSNNATGYGGAVLTNNAELVVQDGATFEQNMAAVGGALYSKGQSCSLSNATFISNNASVEAVPATSGDDDDFNRGGAAGFDSAEVTIADSDFTTNFAGTSGGALWGGADTLLIVDGCTFSNNTTPKSGGAISASNATVGGGTELRYNFADEDGGAVSVGRKEVIPIQTHLDGLP